MNLTIVNTLGQIIYSKLNSRNTETIDMSGYANGVYFLEVKNDNILYVKKIFKD